MHELTPHQTSFCRLAALTAIVLTSAACSSIGRIAERRADQAVYRTIAEAQSIGIGERAPFSLASTPPPLLQQVLEADKRDGEAAKLSLADTLRIAMANSRDYQSEKEDLYLQALELTQTRKNFQWNFDSSVNAQSSMSETVDGERETFGDQGADISGEARVSRLLPSGARMSLNFTRNIEAFSAADTERSTGNDSLSFSVIQPLLNGAGALITMEPLRQAERDLIYAVRGFKRSQQDFIIETTSRFYSTLQSRDQLNNQRKNFESSVLNRKQSEYYAKAGRIADFQAAEALQSELDAADRWAVAQANYEASLDDFRFSLGLPIDLNVVPDTNELIRLQNIGIVELDITRANAVDTALSNRLDLITSRQRLQDRERTLKIRERDFLPQLGARANANEHFDSPEEIERTAGITLDLDLPFDWTEKRNAYRSAQISHQRAERSLQELQDNIRRNVRDLWRTLKQNQSVYNNRLRSVELSKQRVENTQLLLKQGKARTRDLLDAEDDLLNSENQATAALVDYTVNRLRFWHAIERFEIEMKDHDHGTE